MASFQVKGDRRPLNVILAVLVWVLRPQKPSNCYRGELVGRRILQVHCENVEIVFSPCNKSQTFYLEVSLVFQKDDR